MPLDFGYTVTIGCQKFAVETSEKMFKSLSEYLNDPSKIENEWLNGDFLK